MDLVSLCPFVASTVVWQANSGAFALTVIVKATFVLQPGTAQLASEQDPIFEHDRFYDEDPRRSVRFPSDVVPYKPRADVLLVGHAYAPDKQPVRSLVTRFVVGDMDKSIEVFCDRAFRVLDAQLLEGKRFTKMPLVWERASGGPESANPVGKRFDGPTDAYGTIAIANLQPPGHFVSKRSDTFVPMCYAPVAPTWPGRTQRLGRLSRTILDGAWQDKPLPVDLDPTFFQAAPPDQNVAEIRANERIVLENLHPEHPHLVMSLPDLRPRAIVDRATGEREEIALVGDTLFVDTDRGVCCVVWRGRIGLRSADEAGTISVTLDGGTAESGEPDELQLTMPPQGQPVQRDEEDLAGRTLFGAFLSQASAPVMPFAGADKQSPGGEAIRNLADAALPFGGGGLAALRTVETPAPDVGDGTMFTLMPKVPIPEIPAAIAAPLPAPPPLIAPPPMIMKPPVVEPVAPVASGASPWAPIGSTDEPRLTMGQMAAQTTPTVTSEATPTKSAAGSQSIPKEVIELIHIEADSAYRFRANAEWKKIIADVRPRSTSREADEDIPPDMRQQHRNARDTMAILARGEVLNEAGIRRAYGGAISDDGAFTPPLVLIAGDFRLQFDAIEVLRTLVILANPVASANKKLRELLDAAEELLKQPLVFKMSAESLALKIREQMVAGGSVSKPEMQNAITQILCERGSHHKRRFFKKEWLGGSVKIGTTVLPAYIPEAAIESMPKCSELRIKGIADLRPRMVADDAAEFSLFFAALGRSLNPPSPVAA